MSDNNSMKLTSVMVAVVGTALAFSPALAAAEEPETVEAALKARQAEH